MHELINKLINQSIDGPVALQFQWKVDDIFGWIGGALSLPPWR
jgi:hypothetical protein